MLPRPLSLRRLALLLCLPVLLVAGMGAWVITTEPERTLAEWKPAAQDKARSVVLQLPFQLSPEINYPGNRLIAFALMGLTRYLGAHVYLGNDPPPAGESWPAATEVRSALAAGNHNEARRLLTKHQSALSAEIYRPDGRRDYSPGGLPVSLIVSRMEFDAAEEGERASRAGRLCEAAKNNLSEVSSRAMRDALPFLPPDERENQEAVARETDGLMQLIAERARQHRLSGEPGLAGYLSGSQRPGSPERGEWMGDWLVRARNGQTLELIPYGPWCELMAALLEETGIREISGLPVTVHISWHGRSVTPSASTDGVLLALESAGPWSVGILTDGREPLSAEVNARRIAKAQVFGGLTLVSALAAWVVYRGFRKQVELARLQSEFVASVSHELRTPVAGISALAERLESGAADAEQTTEYHRMIAREGRRLAALVDNVLDFSRIERGARAYEREPVDLPRLILETTALLRPAAEEKGLTITEEIADIPEELWPPVDAVAMRQALVNLLDNAVKFTPGGGSVTVGMELRGPEQAVVIFVRDTGVGIAAGEQAKIFEKFYRVDNGLCRETTGAGIGLSIVKHIAAAHGASVIVTSEPGKGAEFAIRFRHAMR